MFAQMAAFLLGYTAILAVPGPNVFAVGALAALRGARAAFPVAIGAAFGATVLAAMTLSALRMLPTWQATLKIVGASLLVLVAWRIMRLKANAHAAERQSRAWSVEFASGFCTAITNPITAAYFTGAFAASSGLDSIEATGLIVGSVSVVSAAFYLGALRLFSSPAVRSIARTWHAAIRLGAGSFLVLLAVCVLQGALE